MLSKNVNNKKCAPKLIFFDDKKMRKIRTIFDIENRLWKSNFGTFWHLPINPILKIQVCWFSGKNLSNFVPPAWKLHNPCCHNGRPLMFLLWFQFPCNENVTSWSTDPTEEIFSPMITTFLMVISFFRHSMGFLWFLIEIENHKKPVECQKKDITIKNFVIVGE